MTMRDSAVLNRPAPRDSIWQASAAGRIPVQPKLILLAGLFLLAVAVGFGVTRIIPGGSTQRVSDTEYAAVVAQLYNKDRNLALARERLSAVGDPSDLVRRAIAAGQAGRLASPSDSPALDTLSAALVATPLTATVDQTAAGTPGASAPSTSAESESRVSWIGPLVAFFLALALGFLVLARTAGLSLTTLRLPWRIPTPRPRTSSLRRPSAMPSRSHDNPRQSTVSIAEVDLDLQDRGLTQIEPASTRLTSIRRSRGATAVATRPSVFQSSYRFGDDPFEEIHPISDPRTGGLIAACGLTATLHLDSGRSGGYYAFTAWIQDYAGGDELHAAGLVAPGATEIERKSIDSWVQSGQVDTVLPIEPNATVVVGTDDIKATISVIKVEYGADDRMPEAYITSLDVRFEIHQD